jgi:RsiW-degrading membrane proteinase PrsW (M82 family)
MNPHLIIYALVGGILPALLWLIFWLEEDKRRPEPRGRLLITFVLGMCATIAVLPFERKVSEIWPGFTLATFALWAVIEEFFKFFAAYIGALRSRDDDEPIDPIVYMIVAALGFVALENTLFIIGPLVQPDLIPESAIVQSITTGQLRFIGASLLHVVASSTIGASLAFTFYKKRSTKRLSLVFGFLLAAFFHTAFNIFIYHGSEFGTFMTFATVWAGVTTLFWIFERVKSIAP